MDYAFVKKFQCVRLPAGKDVGNLQCDWTMNIAFPYKPTIEVEEFQLRLRFQAHDGDNVFEIQDYTEKKRNFVPK